MFGIIGKMGSGKSTVIKILEEQYGLSCIAPYTTRPIRPGEVEGKDYLFLTNEEFDAKEEEDFFAETHVYQADFGYCQYGTAKDAYYQNNHGCVILNPYSVRQLREKGIPVTIIYLLADEKELKKRLKARGDSKREIVRRLKADEDDFSDMREYVDFVIDTRNLSAEEVAKKVYEARECCYLCAASA